MASSSPASVKCVQVHGVCVQVRLPCVTNMETGQCHYNCSDTNLAQDACNLLVIDILTELLIRALVG